MSERLKTDLDVYIQVSRTVFCPKVSKSGLKVTEEIDINYGEQLGNYSDNFEEYYNSLDKGDVKNLLIDTFSDFQKEEEDNLKTGEFKKGEEYNIFLLCHENLEKKLKSTDEKVRKGFYKEGEYEKCHRRVLARYVYDNFGIFIPEYDIQECNKDIVYTVY